MMKVILMMILFIISPVCAQTQEKPSAMELALSQKKSRSVQFELSRANQTCAGVMDCAEDFRSTTGISEDPCLWNRLACHMESFSRGNDLNQIWLLGGAKLKTKVGPLTFSVGRHKDNIILTRAPFIESSYRMNQYLSLGFGVLQTQTGTGPQNLWYIVLRNSRWE